MVGLVTYHWSLTGLLFQVFLQKEMYTNKALLELHPALTNNCGAEALSITSISAPFLIVIEDINRSREPLRLLEKIVSWDRSDNDRQSSVSWKILCPVWPKYLNSLDNNILKSAAKLVISCASFSAEEGTEAIQKKYRIAEKTITALRAGEIATTLGNDPLLIALHDVDTKPDPDYIIQRFIDNKLIQLANAPDGFIAAEYQDTLFQLLLSMYEAHILQPMWSDLNSFVFSEDQKKMLRQIAQQGQIFRLIGDVASQTIVFRHDRVRDWLAANAIACQLSSVLLSDAFISEPHFSRVIGLALNSEKVTIEIVRRVQKLNPLALFYALQVFSVAVTDTQKAVVTCIHDWLDKEDTNKKTNDTLCQECLNVLAETDSPEVLHILEKIQKRSWSYYRAGFRNGHIGHGIKLCRRVNPGTTSLWHEQLIHYVISKDRIQTINIIQDIIKQGGLNSDDRSGILRFCGYIADDGLRDSLRILWGNESESERINLFQDYLWACARCCGDSPEMLLDPIFKMYSTAKKQGNRFKNDYLETSEIRFAFRRYIPTNAIKFFIDLSKQDDFSSLIRNMIHGIDHPAVINFEAHNCADFPMGSDRERHSSFYTRFRVMDWQGRQGKTGQPMSVESRQALFELWSNINTEELLRLQSFKLWAATIDEKDLSILQKVEQDDILSDVVLQARCLRKDCSVVPQLVNKIKEHWFWWQFSKFVWAPELTDLLDEEFIKRSLKASRKWSDFYFESDEFTHKLIMRLSQVKAENMLIKHWDHLKFSSLFIQTALYTATAKLVSMVRDVVNECPEPQIIFKHLSFVYGIKNNDHPGVVRIQQMTVLIPYINHLDEFTIHQLFGECNENGWFEFRRKHLDSYFIGSKYSEAKYLDIKKTYMSLDEMLNPEKNHLAFYWVNDFLKTGVSEDEVMNVLFDWIRSKGKISLNMVTLSLVILVQVGSRAHYDG